MEQQEIALLTGAWAILGGTLAVTWVAYLLTPEAPLYDVNPAREIQKETAGKIVKITLWEWAVCHTDEKGNYVLTLPNASKIDTGSKVTTVNAKQVWVYVGATTVGKGIKVGIWRDPEEVCDMYTRTTSNVLSWYALNNK